MEIIDLPSLQKNKEEFQMPDPVGWEIFFQEETFDCILILDINYKYLTNLIIYDTIKKSINPISKLHPMLLKYPQLCKKYNIDVVQIQTIETSITKVEGQWVKGY